MILNDTKFNLLDYADKTGVSQSLILKFIEEGGADFVNEIFMDYVFEQLGDKNFFDGMTTLGAVSHSQEIMLSVFNNFQKQFDVKNPQ